MNFWEIDGDQRQRADIAGQRVRIVAGREPNPDLAASQERFALGAPECEGTIAGTPKGTSASETRLAQQRPAILDDRPILNEPWHRRVP